MIGFIGWGVGVFVVGVFLKMIYKCGKDRDYEIVDYIFCFYIFVGLMFMGLIIVICFKFEEKIKKLWGVSLSVGF